MSKPLKLGVAGLGTVGAGLFSDTMHNVIPLVKQA